MEVLSLIIGALGLIVPILFGIIRYRMDFPQLPFKYGIFRGHKVKRDVVDVVIIRNGDADYTKQIQSGLLNRAANVFARTEFAIRFAGYEGGPYVEDDARNKWLISELLEDNPDILITIGSQVSMSAAKHFNERLPIIAVGLGAPIRSGLIDLGDNCSINDANIACVRYGVRIDTRIEYLSKLFAKSKKSFKFIFIWNSRVPQDKWLAEEVEEIATRRKDITLETLKTEETALPSELDRSENIFFGFYHLNHNLISYLRSASRAVFLGLNPNDTRAGAIASTGNNDYKIGELVVDEILTPKLTKRKKLSHIALVEPKPYYTINRRVAEKKNIAFSKFAQGNAAEIIDF